MDYISAFWFISFFAFFPALKTVPWLNAWVIYAYVYTLIVAQSPVYFDEISIPLRVSMENQSNNFLAILAVFVLFIKSNVTNDVIEKWLSLFGKLALFLSVLSVPFNEPFISGIVPNKGMNAILLVSLLPYSTGKYQKLVFILTSILVVHSLSSSALLAFFVLCALWAVLEKKVNLKTVSAFLCVALVATISNHDLLKGGGRVSSYKFFLSFMDTIRYVFGFGPGSFFPISAFLQHKFDFQMNTGYLIYMHSDLLQYLFEFGAVGFVPLLFTGYNLLRYANRRSLLAICSLLAGGLFYYPFHFPVHLLVFFLLVKISVNNYVSFRDL